MCSVLNSKISNNIIDNYLKINDSLVGCNALTLHNFNEDVYGKLPRLDDLNLPKAFVSELYTNSLGSDSSFERLIYSCLLISSFVKQINPKLQQHQIVNCNFKNIEVQEVELQSLVELFSRVMQVRGYIVKPSLEGCFVINCLGSVSALDIDYIVDVKSKHNIDIDLRLNSAITESLVYSASISKLNDIPKNIVIKDYYKNLLNVKEHLLSDNGLDISTLWDACYMLVYMYVYFNCVSSTDETLIGSLQQPSLGNLIMLDSLMRNKVPQIQHLISDLKACDFLLTSFNKTKLKTGKDLLKLNFMKNIEMVSLYFDKDCNVTKVRFVNHKEMQYILYTLVKTNKPNLEPIDLNKLMDTTFDESLFGEHALASSLSYTALDELLYVMNYIITKLKNKDLYSTRNLIKVKEDIKPRLENFSIVESVTYDRYTLSIILLVVLGVIIRLVTW